MEPNNVMQNWMPYIRVCYKMLIILYNIKLICNMPMSFTNQLINWSTVFIPKSKNAFQFTISYITADLHRETLIVWCYLAWITFPFLGFVFSYHSACLVHILYKSNYTWYVFFTGKIRVLTKCNDSVYFAVPYVQNHVHSQQVTLYITYHYCI